MNPDDMKLEVTVHESGHAVAVRHFGGQLKEISTIYNPEANSSGNCRYSIAHGLAPADKDVISAAGQAASELWNSRYNAGWSPGFIVEGGGTDRAGMHGDPVKALAAAKELLSQPAMWDEVHGFVDHLWNSDGRIVNDIWEMDPKGKGGPGSY